MTTCDGCAKEGERAEATARRAQCAWFALCDHEATATRPHPVLGDVPICERCDARMEAMK